MFLDQGDTVPDQKSDTSPGVTERLMIYAYSDVLINGALKIMIADKSKVTDEVATWSVAFCGTSEIAERRR